jgi:hypothetical protein
MRTPLDWDDPEVRRDALIVIGLMMVGLVFNVLIGLGAAWLIQELAQSAAPSASPVLAP